MDDRKDFEPLEYVIEESRPGWQTSEFWLAAAAQVIPILVLLGVLNPADAVGVKDAVSSVIVTGFAFLAAVATALMYIWSRVKIKTR